MNTKSDQTSADQTFSILLVTADHSRANDLLSRLRAHFEKLPFAIDLAEDGSRALYLLSKKTYFLVLADADLPIMDGLSLVREIRRDDGSLSIFILANKQVQTDEPGVEMVVLPIQNWTDFLTKVEWQLPENARVRYGLKKHDAVLSKLIADYVDQQLKSSDSRVLWHSDTPIAVGLSRIAGKVVNDPKQKTQLLETLDATPLSISSNPKDDRRDLILSLAIVGVCVATFVALLFTEQNAFVQSIRYLLLFLSGFSLFGYFMSRVFERVSKALVKSGS